MSRAYCECPRCRRTFPVKWGWTTLKVACLDDTVGEVATDRDCLAATRVAYPRHVRCPLCGARLRVERELVPSFYASEEGKQYADGAR